MLQPIAPSLTRAAPLRCIPPSPPYAFAFALGSAPPLATTFAPAILPVDHVLRESANSLVTTLVWLVGLTLGNTPVGVLVFDDPFGLAKAPGISAEAVTLVLLAS
jgi:hypothetical protein